MTKPQRLINAQVAEHVFGLKPGIDFGRWDEHDWKRKPDGLIEISGGDYQWGPICLRCHRTEPTYDFWEKIDRRLDEIPHGPCRKEPAAYSTVLKTAMSIINAWKWDVDLRRQNGYWRVEFFQPSYQQDATHQSLPMAICLARLRMEPGATIPTYLERRTA